MRSKGSGLEMHPGQVGGRGRKAQSGLETWNVGKCLGHLRIPSAQGEEVGAHGGGCGRLWTERVKQGLGRG